MYQWKSQTESVIPHNLGITQHPQRALWLLVTCLFPRGCVLHVQELRKYFLHCPTSFLLPWSKQYGQSSVVYQKLLEAQWSIAPPTTLYFWPYDQGSCSTSAVCKFKKTGPIMLENPPDSSCFPLPVMSTSGFLGKSRQQKGACLGSFQQLTTWSKSAQGHDQDNL